MKHSLMSPAFPDLVAAAAAAHANELAFDRAPPRRSQRCLDDIADLLLTLEAELQMAATRIW
jgi:hypothetical protein